MLEELQRRWSERDHYKPTPWNPAATYTPCIAHIIHNCVLAFLEVMSAEPPAKIDLYNREDEQTRTRRPRSSKFGSSTLSQTASTATRGSHRGFSRLDKLEGFALATAKLREIAKASGNSAQRHEQFFKESKAACGKPLELKLDVKTRWHSTAAMLARAVTLRQAISRWVMARPELEALTLNDKEWAHIEIILSILRPFWDCTMELMSAQGITIHKTYAVYNVLFDHFDDFSRKIRGFRRNTAALAHRDQLLQGLDKAKNKLSSYYGQTESNSVYFAIPLS